MENLTKNSLSKLIQQCINELKDDDDLLHGHTSEYEDDDDIEEITTTGDAEGYNTPNAFSDNETKRKKRLKKNIKNSGYETIAEALEDGDIKEIKQLIRSMISDIIRDIWIKRSSWNRP